MNDSVTSVLNQTYTNWELIVAVNGHNKDSSVYHIAKDIGSSSNKIRVYDFYNCRGKSATLNAMVPLCKFDYIAILDVDDIWLPTKLEKQVPFLPYYDVVGTKCVYFGESQPIIPYIPVGNISQYDFILGNPIINSSSVIKKEHCEWNTKYKVEDYYLWLSLRRQNKLFYNCDEVLVKHRIHRASAFNTNGNNKVDDIIEEIYKNT
jgi:glycosyltransferase involved in cell wall biosynthesis